MNLLLFLRIRCPHTDCVCGGGVVVSFILTLSALCLQMCQFEGEDLAISDAMVDLLMGAEDVFTEGTLTLGCSQHILTDRNNKGRKLPTELCRKKLAALVLK